MNDFLKEFKDRGYFYQCTDEKALSKKLNEESIKGYIGFDCTAQSLHVGSLLQIMCLRLMQKHGHKPIVLLGGGTTRIGDPSGKDKTRKILDEDEIERRVLNVSRISTVIIMLLCTLLAWQMLDMNVTIIVWIGTGCMMAAFSGPLILGAVWSGVTKAGAFAGLLSGGLVFMITFNAVIDPEWFSPGVLRDASVWLQKESPNPWSCAAMGEVVSIALTVIVSKLTQQLPDEHIDKLFAPQS